jgi:S1-C subfamily serine protease
MKALSLTAQLLGLFLTAAVVTLLNGRASPGERLVRPGGGLAEAEKTSLEVYRLASPSVVHVTTRSEAPAPGSINDPKALRGRGPGFVWDEKGHIVTSHRTVAGADRARVILADRSAYPARLVASYPEADVAVFKIAAPRGKLRPIPIGSSRDLKLGQVVFTLGDPFGVDRTFGRGVVSALGRQVNVEGGRPIRGLIQTTATAPPGGAGGPLLDSAGRLIGMSLAFPRPAGTLAGVGLAVPVDELNRVVPRLIRSGKVAGPGSKPGR